MLSFSGGKRRRNYGKERVIAPIHPEERREKEGEHNGHTF